MLMIVPPEESTGGDGAIAAHRAHEDLGSLKNGLKLFDAFAIGELPEMMPS
jgi:hypothetical protein